MAYKVGDVAKLAHVSIRTLHHYDELGLLTPSERSEAGYRLYTHGDLERLQQVLFYRELGFGLEEIAEMMNDPGFDRTEALIAQRELIAERVLRYEAMLDLIDTTLISSEGGIRMTKEEMFGVFGDFDPAEYEDEVQERWGDTDAYRESARRTKRYTKADWERYKAESDQVTLAIAALMNEGVPADDPRAMEAVEAHRMLIDTWFYPCSKEMHAGLGAMYVSDPRFTQTYDKVAPGLASYICDATAAVLASSDS